MKELSELHQLEKADPENTKYDTLHPLAATESVTKSRSREVSQKINFAESNADNSNYSNTRTKYASPTVLFPSTGLQ